jgi:hypothetical protein
VDISLFLAQVFGLYFVLAGVAILIRPTSTIELMQLFSNRSTTFMSGFIALVIGVPLVLLHNIWDGSWRVIITVLVWITLLKGIARIYMPDLVASWADTLVAYPRLVRHMVWVLVIAGMYLMYLGFEWSA